MYIPDSAPEDAALSRTTHLGIGAHQDDLEFMALHGIHEAQQNPHTWFGGITCTDGAGSARTGRFAKLSDAEMATHRRQEQNEAARIGRYSFMTQLAYPSAAIKNDPGPMIAEIVTLLQKTVPRTVYTHNPADKHDTHVAVTLAVIRAIRQLPPACRPNRVLGCEVWRGLDWMPDDAKVVLDISDAAPLADQLATVFASQIEGGKRYDRAVDGRARANATFLEPGRTDTIKKAWLAMDMTPLIEDDSLDVIAFTLAHIQHFQADTATRLARYQPSP